MTHEGGQLGKDFADVLRGSIQAGIVSVFGRQTAIAVEFYVDSSLAAKDIVAYTNALEKVFGKGSSLIEERCAQILYSNLGLEFELKDNQRLSDYVMAARGMKKE